MVGRLERFRSQLTLAAMADLFSDEQIAKFKEKFYRFVKDPDGTIKTMYVEKVMHSLGLATTEGEVINMADADGNGTLNFDQFLSLMAKRMSDTEKQAEDDGFHIFWLLRKQWYCSD